MVALHVRVDYNSGTRARESGAYFGCLKQFSKHEQHVCAATLAEPSQTISRKVSSLASMANFGNNFTAGSAITF